MHTYQRIIQEAVRQAFDIATGANKRRKPIMTVKITTDSSTTDRLVMLMAVKESGAGWTHLIKDNLILCANSTIKAGDYSCELVVDNDLEYLLRIVDLPCADYQGQCDRAFGKVTQ